VLVFVVDDLLWIYFWLLLCGFYLLA